MMKTSILFIERSVFYTILLALVVIFMCCMFFIAAQ
jgi:hypothetical protein